MDRPADLFDREREWADLGQFVSSGQHGLQIGIVYGRRRQGKSFLLRRLVAAQRGIYCLALEEQRRPALERFGRCVALLREDPTITDRALYQSVLTTIAGGQTTPGGIAAALGRDARSLWHPLDVLRAGGFVRRSEDVLTRRRPIYTVADPIIRFGMLIVRPRQAMYEERHAPAAWEASTEAFGARVLGPHIEDLSREWTRRFAAATTLGGPVGIVGQAVLNDPTGLATHELDVIALAAGEQLHAQRAVIRAIGEAKATNRPRSVGDLDRLDRIRGLLAHRGHDARQARLLLFSRTGFTGGLLDAARSRGDVELIDLARLYTGD